MNRLYRVLHRPAARRHTSPTPMDMAGHTLGVRAGLRQLRQSHRLLRAHRSWRLATLLGVGGVMIAILLATASSLGRFPLLALYGYVLFAAWYGEGWESCLALAVASLSTLVLLPTDQMRPASAVPTVQARLLAQVLFVLLSLALLGTVALLRRAERHARAALRRRESGLPLVAHDLRTPLTSITGFAELLDHRVSQGAPVDPGWLRTQIGHIQAAATQMGSMVNELSDLHDVTSPTEQCSVPRSLSSVDLRDVARDVCQMVSAAHATQRVTLDAPSAVVLYADRMHLARILQNLVDNALKYSPAQSVVEVRLGRQQGAAVLSVTDHGVGIPAAETPHVFTRGYRAASAAGVPGRGLGLASATALVERLDGHISCVSALGQGTTMTVVLPLHSPDGVHDQTPARPHDGGARHGTPMDGATAIPGGCALTFARYTRAE